MNAVQLPFHPSPKRPDIGLPKGACDAHCHVFGPAGRFPFAPERSYTPQDAPKETLFALHDMLGLERAVLVQASCHGRDNRALVDALAARPDTSRGIAMVNADILDTELEDLHAAGVRGVRFNFVSHLGADASIDAVRTVVDKIKPLGWHLVVYFDADRLEMLRPVLQSIPLTMVIDHMGRVDSTRGLDQPAYRMLVDLLDDERFWVKVCGSERISKLGPPFADAVPFARDLVARFPDRVLWGTDWPHPNMTKWMPDDGALVDLLGEIAPDETSLHRLLVHNPTRLYWPETEG